MIHRRTSAIVAMSLSAIAIASLFMWAAGRHSAGQTASFDSQLALYDRYRSILAFEPRLSSIEGNRSADAYNELFMSGGTPAEVSANLTGQLNEITQGSGVQVLRTSNLPLREHKAITLAGSEFEITGQVAAIYAVIQKIEDARPFLVIEKFSVRSNSAYQPENAEEQPVSATLSVYAATKRNQDGPSQVQSP